MSCYYIFLGKLLCFLCKLVFKCSPPITLHSLQKVANLLLALSTPQSGASPNSPGGYCLFRKTEPLLVQNWSDRGILVDTVITGLEVKITLVLMSEKFQVLSS